MYYHLAAVSQYHFNTYTSQWGFEEQIQSYLSPGVWNEK